MNPHPFDFGTDEKLAERHRAALNTAALYNADPLRAFSDGSTWRNRELTPLL